MSFLLPHLHSGYAVDQAILHVRCSRRASSRAGLKFDIEEDSILNRRRRRPLAHRPAYDDYPTSHAPPDETPHPHPLTPPTASFSSLQEESRVVIIRFGSDADDTCMQMDETLASVADKMKNFAVVYLVDITEVPDFNAMYELYDPCTVMFFFRNRVRARCCSLSGV